ncbi:MAG: hypothetical protein ABJD97_21205 [Betaproteobacteria bacterium]
MAITQKNIDNLHAMLLEHAYNDLGGNAAKQAELMTVCLDMKTYCMDGKWDALDANYKSVWLGEITRRIDRIVPNAQTVIAKVKKTDITQAMVLSTFSTDGVQILRLLFSQYTINRHFQGHYEGQPAWLAGKEVLDVARILRQHPERSNDLRIRAHYHAGQWVALNNRGFALHSLANVVPQRIAFDTALSSDEQERLGRNFASQRLNLGASLPESRRRKQDWEATIPSSFTGVPETRNSTDVVYTIKAIKMTPGAPPDNGNETVLNSKL